MARYERSVRIEAPIEDVWQFHSTPTGLEQLTPQWTNLVVESVDRPADAPDSETLVVGSTLDVSLGPFNIGPRQRFVSEITARERADGCAYFTDVMHEGPFQTWQHTHQFVADGDATLLTDVIEYQLPGGILGRTVSPLAVIGFAPGFRYRHTRTRRLLE